MEFGSVIGVVVLIVPIGLVNDLRHQVGQITLFGILADDFSLLDLRRLEEILFHKGVRLAGLGRQGFIHLSVLVNMAVGDSKGRFGQHEFMLFPGRDRRDGAIAVPAKEHALAKAHTALIMDVPMKAIVLHPDRGVDITLRQRRFLHPEVLGGPGRSQVDPQALLFAQHIAIIQGGGQLLALIVVVIAFLVVGAKDPIADGDQLFTAFRGSNIQREMPCQQSVLTLLQHRKGQHRRLRRRSADRHDTHHHRADSRQHRQHQPKPLPLVKAPEQDIRRRAAYQQDRQSHRGGRQQRDIVCQRNTGGLIGIGRFIGIILEGTLIERIAVLDHQPLPEAAHGLPAAELPVSKAEGCGIDHTASRLIPPDQGNALCIHQHMAAVSSRQKDLLIQGLTGDPQPLQQSRSNTGSGNKLTRRQSRDAGHSRPGGAGLSAAAHDENVSGFQPRLKHLLLVGRQQADIKAVHHQHPKGRQQIQLLREVLGIQRHGLNVFVTQQHIRGHIDIHVGEVLRRVRQHTHQHRRRIQHLAGLRVHRAELFAVFPHFHGERVLLAADKHWQHNLLGCGRSQGDLHFISVILHTVDIDIHGHRAGHIRPMILQADPRGHGFSIGHHPVIAHNSFHRQVGAVHFLMQRLSTT